MPSYTDILRLRTHLPRRAWPVVENWLRRNSVLVRISPPRVTKLGDYRTATRTQPHRISVNEDLNPYSFLVVLVHEFAHFTTFSKYRRHEPHGAEWKAEYKRLMRPFLSREIFPADVLRVLILHLNDAPSSSCTDHVLMRVLRRYDREPSPFLEELEQNTVFRFNRKLFVKGPRLRKRYRCRCLNNRRIYLIDPTAEVQLDRPLSARKAG
ncbi:MAG: SprT-like domain-containing protein [Flavobacteriales bacterium]|nr:SprT-like domain-containing protein [Flavobacteriales bacterium]HRN36152.1 SprT-like domain-containing protein [Flavobacteriales bacterium]HRO40436.1 SprT-like domain-containing protein [Flavobacteriales bacterium]HRP82643.1 SprT-like domain-containing protein [Flavobacteriales bacterium]